MPRICPLPGWCIGPGGSLPSAVTGTEPERGCVAQQEVLRAFQFELDPAPAQVEVLSRHADATWGAFNRALGG